MKARGAVLGALGLLGAMGIACSILYTPSSYSDPSGTLTVIGQSTSPARAIVLTTADVVFQTDTGIFTLPKLGGTPTLVQSAPYGAIAALASDGDLVAFCGSLGVEAFRPGGSVVAIDPNVRDCRSIAVRGSTVAVGRVESTGPDDDGGAPTLLVDVYDVEGSSPLSGPTTELTIPSKAAGLGTALVVALRANGAVYAATTAVVLGPDAPRPLCARGPATRTLVQLELADLGDEDGGADAGLLWLLRGAQYARLGTNDHCCSDSDIEGGCPDTVTTNSNAWLGAAIAGGSLYVLSNNGVLETIPVDRAATSAGWPDGDVVRDDLGTNLVGALAVDGHDAYFGDDDGRIERLVLR